MLEARETAAFLSETKKILASTIMDFITKLASSQSFTLHPGD